VLTNIKTVRKVENVNMIIFYNSFDVHVYLHFLFVLNFKAYKGTYNKKQK